MSGLANDTAAGPIVVAVDFASYAEATCDTAAELAGRLGVPVMLLHVMALPHGLKPDTPLASEGTGEMETVSELLTDDARAHMQALIDRFTDAGVEVSLCLRFGEVISEILQCLGDAKPQMLVVGCDVPHGVISRLFGRSFTEDVLRVAKCPVLVVPHGDEPPTGRSEAQWQVVAEADG